MKTVKKLTSLILLIAMFPVLSFAKGIEFKHISLDEALELAKKENKSVFIDIYATWCGPCKYLSKNIFTDEDLGDYMNENFICIKLDGEESDGDNLMYEFDLSSYPTMLFIDGNKKLLKKLVGAVPASDIKNAAMTVMDPSSTAVFKLNKKYEDGNRDRDFLADFIDELTNEESDKTDEVVNEFIKLYPDLDLEDEKELLIFCLGINDLNHSLVKEFMSNAKDIGLVNQGYAQWKSANLLLLAAEDAIENNNKSLIKKHVSRLYPTYKKLNGEEALSENEVIDELEEMFEESEM